MADDGTGCGGSRKMPCLLRAVFLACSLWHIVASKDIQPSCLTDYDAEVVCRWEVDASTDCTKEFLLNITTTHVLHGPGKSWVCSPETERGLVATPNCTCIIRSRVLDKYKYHFSLEANGKEIWQRTVKLDDIVKPRPLVSLTANRTKDSYLLTWRNDYKAGNVFRENVGGDYEVAYWPEGQSDKVRTGTTNNFHYTIFAEKLVPGASYVARVRQKNEMWDGRWSDWSVPCKWKNEFEPKSDDILWVFIFLLCVFIMALATIGFLCFTRVKKGWWDQIPSPAKSKAAAGVTVAPVRDLGLEHPVPIDSCIASAKPETRKEEDCQIPHEDAMAKLFRDLLSGDLSSGGTSILDERPLLKDQAPEHMPAFSFSQDAALDKHRGVSERSSEPVYHNTNTETVAFSQPGSPTLEPPLSHSLFFPEAQSVTMDTLFSQGGGGTTAAPQPSGYKCFSSLVAEPMAGSSQIFEEEEFSHCGEQIRPFSHDKGSGLAPGTSSLHPEFQGVFPEDPDSLRFSSCMEAAERETRSGSPSQHALGKPDPSPAASFLAGYRSFSSALQGGTAPQGKNDSAGSGLDGQSPYKPLLSVVQNSPAAATGMNRILFHPGWGTQEVGDPAWPNAPCGVDLGMQQVASDGCFREDVARDRGPSYP